MYAVVTTGGKQYRVEPGSELTIERLAGDAGSSITFDRVLLVGDGETVTVGTPTVDGASVSGTVLGEALGPKLIVFKFKQKATYRRKNGHRQHLTRVRIDEINASGKKAKADKADKADKPEKRDDEPVKAGAATEAEKPKRTRKAATAKPDAPATAGKADTAKADKATESDKPKRARKASPKE
jgi:large subunit ribosomal protein L21